MALDPELFDTYKAYKAGTAKLVTWLATAAKETHLVDHLFQEKEVGGVGPGRLKGKARAVKKNQPKGTTQTYEIRLADFTALADAVATIQKNVPDMLLQTLEEVIAARQGCTDFYKQSNAPDMSTKTSNAQHEHFIGILQKTYAILKPLANQSPQTEKPRAVTPAEDPTAELGNLFNYLELEEPAEWTSANLPTASKNAKKIAYELERTYGDVSFAIFCLFKDLTDIRAYVRQVWAEYREGQVALTTAALTANTAISIFRRLNEEFLDDNPEFDHHGKILHFIHTGYCDPQNTNEEDFRTYTGAGFKLPSRVFFCDHTYELLFGYVLRSNIPFYQAHVSQKFTKDEIVILKCLSHICLISSLANGDVHQDQLIKGIHTIKRDKILYPWVVFAVQLMVDTRRVVGKDGLDRCLKEAHQLQQWMSKSMRESEEFGRTNTFNTWYKLNSTALPRLRQGLEATLKEDWLQKAVDEYLGARAHLYPWGSFLLLRNHPMLLGLIVSKYLGEFHKLGVGLAGDQLSVLTAVHLYSASQTCQQKSTYLYVEPTLHQRSFLTAIPEWIDMEKIIAWQGSAWIFMGDRPTDSGQAFRHYGFVTGVSTIASARDRRGRGTHNASARGLPVTRHNIRKLKPMSRYVELATARNPSKVGQERWPESRAAGDPMVMLESVVARYIEESQAKTSNHASNTHKQKMSPLNMLRIFRDSMHADEEILRFDLLALNQRCCELMREVQKICVELSDLDYPLDEYAGDRNANAVYSHMMAGELGLERAQSTRFAEARLLVKDIVEAFGDAEYQKARARCFVDENNKKKITETFETPFEDNFLPSQRDMFGEVMIYNGGPGGLRSLY